MRAANISASGSEAFQGLSGNSFGARVYGEMANLNASRVQKRPVGCGNGARAGPCCLTGARCPGYKVGAAAPPKSSAVCSSCAANPDCFDVGCTLPSDACCDYDCCSGSACDRYAKSCSVKKFPEACSDVKKQPHCFNQICSEEPGMAGSWTGYDVLATGCGGSTEYFRNINEARMARENPTALATCVNRELDVPFMDAITPEKPLPISMAGTDVFGSILMHSSAKGTTLDIRGEAVTAKPLGPPPEGAGVTGIMGKTAYRDEVYGADKSMCKYATEIMEPTCGASRVCGEDWDNTVSSHGRKKLFKLPAYDSNTCSGAQTSAMRVGIDDAPKYASCYGCGRRAARRAAAASSTPAPVTPTQQKINPIDLPANVVNNIRDWAMKTIPQFLPKLKEKYMSYMNKVSA